SDRVVVRQGSVADARRERAVHVFEVHVANARTGIALDLERVLTTERDVPCVEAQGVRRDVKEPFDVLRPLDRSTPVRMHRDAEAVRVGDLDNAVDALEELGPGAVRKLGSTGVAALRERRSEDDELRAARGQPFRLAFDGGELVSAARALVE